MAVPPWQIVVSGPALAITSKVTAIACSKVDTHPSFSTVKVAVYSPGTSAQITSTTASVADAGIAGPVNSQL